MKHSSDLVLKGVVVDSAESFRDLKIDDKPLMGPEIVDIGTLKGVVVGSPIPRM